MTDQLTVSRDHTGPLFSYNISYHFDFVSLPDVIRRSAHDPSRICLISDGNVAALYLDEVTAALSSLGAEVSVFCIPAGERSKTLASAQAVYRFLADRRFARNDLIAALGGGVVGDLAGFAAATYMRGIDLVQIPTSLLAQVDSSVGGKTAVDLDGIKNMIGAFHQPRTVYMNMSTLRTLPDAEFLAGMGEVLKTALLSDRRFFEYLMSVKDAVFGRGESVLADIVRKCCAYKADIVGRDPEERTGVRAVLNLGHTIGHAVERCTGASWVHGLCVAAGIVGAARISSSRGLLSDEELDLVVSGIRAYGLPCGIPDIPDEDLLAAMRSDKKKTGELFRFILLRGIGDPVAADDVQEEEIIRALNELRREI